MNGNVQTLTVKKINYTINYLSKMKARKIKRRRARTSCSFVKLVLVSENMLITC